MLMWRTTFMQIEKMANNNNNDDDDVEKKSSHYIYKSCCGDIPFNVFSWKNHFPIKTVSCCGWPPFRVDHIEIFSTKRYECCHRVYIWIGAYTHTLECSKLCLCSTAAKWSSCLYSFFFFYLSLWLSCILLTQELFASFSAFVHVKYA